MIGAIGGGIAGGAVGAYMDKQKQDLEKALAPEIQAGQARIDKLPNDVLRITMTNQTAFDTDSSTIKSGFNSTMDKLADVVVRYGKTTLTVVGHTDNVGTNDYNQKLSERRAHSVAAVPRVASASTACASRWRARARRSRSRATPPRAGRQAEPPRRDLRRARGTRIDGRKRE